MATGSASGAVVVDADGAAGLALLRQLANRHGGLPPVPVARSGRQDGGLHLFFMPRADNTPTNSGDGLDVRGEGGLVVLPPTVHASGRLYAWIRQGPRAAILPDWLLAWFRERGQRRPKGDTLGLGERPAWLSAEKRLRLPADHLPAADLAAALEVIPNPDLGWDAWNRMLMAVWSCCGGEAWGEELAERWSRKSNKWSESATAERWAAYGRSPPAELGFGTLVYEARRAVPGWLPPSQAPVLVTAEQQAAPNDLFGPLETKNSGNINGVHALSKALTKEISTNPLIRLNEQYAVIGDIGGKCLVLGWTNSRIDPNLKVPSFQSFKSFAERYGNAYVTVSTVNKKGEKAEETRQLGSHWLKWPHRRSYEAIDLVPGAPTLLPSGALNLWSGFGVTPSATGGWSRMLWHICNILAAKDPAAASYILRYAAWAVQHPDQRAEVALVFRGGKGTGKGTFANALRRIFGQHGLQIFSSRHLVGQFNGHLRNCVLLFADEAFWAGDRQGESVLKGLLTEPTLMIEQKGVDATPWPNYLHVIMSANAEWVVPASHDERRYAMFDVSDAVRNDFPYFKALHAELAAGGLAAMLHDLQQVRLEGWHPRQIVQTEALRQQKERSLGSLAGWWESLLQDGLLPFHSIRMLDEAPAADILDHAKRFATRPHEVNGTSLGRYLRTVGAKGLHAQSGNFWRFPALDVARRAFGEQMGGWRWRANIDKWRSSYVETS